VFLLGFGWVVCVAIRLVPIWVVVHSVSYAKGVVEAEVVSVDLPVVGIWIENRLAKSFNDVFGLRSRIDPALFLFFSCIGQRLGDRLLSDLLIRDRVIDLTGYWSTSVVERFSLYS